MKLRAAHGVVFVKVSMLLVSLALISQIAQALSIQEFGKFILYFSLINFLVVVLQLGLNVYLVKNITKLNLDNKLPEASRLATQCFAICMVATIFLSAIFLVTVRIYPIFLEGEMAWFLPQWWEALFMAFWLLFAVAIHLIAEVLRGNKRVLTATIVMTGLPFLLAFLGLLLLRENASLVEVIKIYTFAYSISFILGLCLACRYFASAEILPLNSQLLLLGRSFLLMGVALIIVDQIDIWLVSIFGTPEDVAIYGAVNRLARLIFFPMVIINAFSGPLIAELLHSSDFNGVESYARGGHWVALLCAVGVYGLYLIFSDLFLIQFFGDEFSSGRHVLLVAGAFQIMNCATALSLLILSMSGNQKAVLLAAVSVVILKTLSCAVLSLEGFNLSAYSILILLLSSLYSIFLVCLVWRKVGVWVLPSYRNVQSFKQIAYEARA